MIKMISCKTVCAKAKPRCKRPVPESRYFMADLTIPAAIWARRQGQRPKIVLTNGSYTCSLSRAWTLQLQRVKSLCVNETALRKSTLVPAVWRVPGYSFLQQITIIIVYTLYEIQRVQNLIPTPVKPDAALHAFLLSLSMRIPVYLPHPVICA